jgi:hypothetical protein
LEVVALVVLMGFLMVLAQTALTPFLAALQPQVAVTQEVEALALMAIVEALVAVVVVLLALALKLLAAQEFLGKVMQVGLVMLMARHKK